VNGSERNSRDQENRQIQVKELKNGQVRRQEVRARVSFPGLSVCAQQPVK
jgi:hypothetical protein